MNYQQLNERLFSEMDAHKSTKRQLSERTAVLYELLEALAKHPDHAHIQENIDKGNYALAAADVKKRIKEQVSNTTNAGGQLIAGIWIPDSSDDVQESNESDWFNIPDNDDSSDDDFNVITY